jgi:predicted regulator of Ras-like GTPase activity (Roadblock/LC7/MglB family)
MVMVDELNERKHEVKAVIISTSNGVPLVSVKVDESFNEELIAPFFSAIKNFSEEQIGSLSESLIKGGDSDVLVVQEHELILIAIMDKSLKKINIEREAREALHNFHEMFEEEIHAMDEGCVDLQIFKQFEDALKKQIKNYYSKIDVKKKGDGGFFSKIFGMIKKIKD